MNLNKFLKISISFFLIVFLFSIFYFLFFDIVLAINLIPREITKAQIKNYYPDAPDKIIKDQLDEFNKISPIKITEEQLDAYNSGGSIKLTDEQRDAAWDAIKAGATVDVGSEDSPEDSPEDSVASKDYPWTGVTDFGGLVSKFYNIALGLVGVAALGAIIYGGILWTVSKTPSGSQEAKDWITGAIWGLLLLLGAYLLFNTIGIIEKGKLVEPGITEITKLPETVSKEEAGPTEIQKADRNKELVDDTETKDFLSKTSSGLISFNKPSACAASFDKNCTSTANLPENAIDGSLRIVGKEIGQKDKGCDCAITITGGTEKSGHAEHGPGKAVVDLRYKGGGEGPNSKLKEYLDKQVGATLKINDRKTTKDGKMNIYFERNKDGTEHFHITFL